MRIKVDFTTPSRPSSNLSTFPTHIRHRIPHHISIHIMNCAEVISKTSPISTIRNLNLIFQNFRIHKDSLL